MASGSRKHLRGGVGGGNDSRRDYTVESSSSPLVSKLVSEFAVFQFFFFFLRVLSDFFLSFYLHKAVKQLANPWN